MMELDQDTMMQELSQLGKETPEMPEDMHERWMRAVRQEASNQSTEEKRIKKANRRKQWTRYLSVAAAMVFVLGGTALTRDQLNPTVKVPKTVEITEDEGSYGGGMGRMAMMSNSGHGEGMSVDYAMADTAMGAENEHSEKKIIRTASMTLATKTYDGSVDGLKKACSQFGGWVAYSSESSGSGGLRTGYYTLRIPADQLDAFLNQANETGRVVKRTENADDVTDSYYDTATRLASKQALMDRLMALTDQAGDLPDLLELETKMADVQYDIDRLQGQLQATEAQVEYAAVDITLREEKEQETMQEGQTPLGQRLMSALTVGWESFSGFVGDVLVFLTAALPFFGIAGVAGLIIRWLVRRRK